MKASMTPLSARQRENAPVFESALPVPAGATYTVLRTFRDVYDADPMLRVSIVKQGIAPIFLDRLASRMSLPKERLLKDLGISPATVSRKARSDKRLSTEDSERALGLARLVGQVEAMVQRSGEPEGFDAATWVADWIEQPLPALEGMKPAQIMDTAEGQAIIANLLARMQSGAYA